MTELIWDGKYKDGRKTAPLRVALPFQTVETVNESTADRQRTRSLFAEGKETDWRNRLIWGDKKYVLPSLLSEFAGKVNLIYIDPPFDTGADFSFTTTISDSDESFTKEPSIIEQKAYRDTWGRGLDSYLQWFYETVVLLHELLAEDGSLYVHLDWHVGHYAKTILDEVFSTENFRNEIIWQRTASHNDPKRYGVIHDTILFYTKSNAYIWKSPKMEQSQEYINQFFVYAESPTGEVVKLKRGEDTPVGWRRFRLGNFASPHPRPNLTYEYKGYKPPKNGWKVSLEKMIELDKQGRLYFPPSKEGRIQTKSYLDEVITNGAS
jgi:adenine specific DNA methylase Mod